MLGILQGLGLTYTRTGIELDRLTHTQRRVLELLEITPPWPEQKPAALTLSLDLGRAPRSHVVGTEKIP
jgi:hypothetical protein